MTLPKKTESGRGMWIHAARDLYNLGGEGTALDVMLSSKFDYGSFGATGALAICRSERGLIENTGELRKYPDYKAPFSVYRLTEKGLKFVTNRLRYLEMRKNRVDGAVHSKWGLKEASTWLTPLDKTDSVHGVSTGLYLDRIMETITTAATMQQTVKERLSILNTESLDMRLGEIKTSVQFSGVTFVYYMDLTELKIAMEVAQSFNFKVAVVAKDLCLAGKVLTQPIQESVGHLLIKEESLALEFLGRFSNSAQSDAENFVTLYGQYLRLLSRMGQ